MSLVVFALVFDKRSVPGHDNLRDPLFQSIQTIAAADLLVESALDVRKERISIFTQPCVVVIVIRVFKGVVNLEFNGMLHIVLSHAHLRAIYPRRRR